MTAIGPAAVTAVPTTYDAATPGDPATGAMRRGHGGEERERKRARHEVHGRDERYRRGERRELARWRESRSQELDPLEVARRGERPETREKHVAHELSTGRAVWRRRL